MLKDSKAFSGFSVKDIDAAHKFYKETLGLDVEQHNEMGSMLTIHINGNDNGILIYPKPNHEPATYTTLNFPVQDIVSVVRGLKERGVEFENYDAEYLKTDADSINRSGGPLIAWFKDPSGNFLSVIENQ